MRSDTLEIAKPIAEKTVVATNPFPASISWMATRVSEYRRTRAKDRIFHLLKRNLGKIPDHLREDIGIDEFQVMGTLERSTRQNRIVVYPFFQTKS